MVSKKSYVVTGPLGGTFHEVLVEWNQDQIPKPKPEISAPHPIAAEPSPAEQRELGSYEDWNQALFEHLFLKSALVDAEPLADQQRLIYIPDELLEAIHEREFHGASGKGKDSLLRAVGAMAGDNWASAFRNLVNQDAERIERDLKRTAAYVKPPAFVTFLAFFVNCALDVWTGEALNEDNEEAMNSAVWLQVNRRLNQHAQIDRKALKDAFGLLEKTVGSESRAGFFNPFTKAVLGTGHIYARAIQRQLPVGPTEVGKFKRLVDGIRGAQLDLAAASGVAEALLEQGDELECRFLGEDQWRTTLLEVLHVLKSDPPEDDDVAEKGRWSLAFFPSFDFHGTRIQVRLLRTQANQAVELGGWAKVGTLRGEFRAKFQEGSDVSAPVSLKGQADSEFLELDLLGLPAGQKVQIALEDCGTVSFALPFFATALNAVRRRKPSVQFGAESATVFAYATEIEANPNVDAHEMSRRGPVGLWELTPAAGASAHSFADALGLKVERAKIQLAATTPNGRMLVEALGMPLPENAGLQVESAGGTSTDGLAGSKCWIAWSTEGGHSEASSQELDLEASCWRIEAAHAAAILASDDVEIQVRSADGVDLSGAKKIVRATFGAPMPEELPGGMALVGFAVAPA